MTYLIKHTNNNFFGGKIFKILAVLLLISIVAVVIGVSAPARSLVSDVLSPFFKSGNFFYGSLGQIPKFFSDRNKLMDENAALSLEIENMRIDIADYESLKYENNQLREELKIKPAGNFITASIIARSPQIPLDSLLLDNGDRDGIKEGDSVLAGDRILIGKIARTSGNRATAALNSFAGAVSYVYVARTNEPLEIKGAGGGGIEAKVPIDFDIVVGDKIMTSSSSEFLTAIVGSVEEEKSLGFKNVLMSLPVNVSKINTVFVWSPNP